jgi:hypothetical protein
VGRGGRSRSIGDPARVITDPARYLSLPNKGPKRKGMSISAPWRLCCTRYLSPASTLSPALSPSIGYTDCAQLIDLYQANQVAGNPGGRHVWFSSHQLTVTRNPVANVPGGYRTVLEHCHPIPIHSFPLTAPHKSSIGRHNLLHS